MTKNNQAALSAGVELITESGIKLKGLSNINPDHEIHYLIYRITNDLDGKYYVGQHKTTDPFDNYMGSGLYIRKEEQIYGISVFTKEILYDFSTFDEMNNKEEELVQLSNCFPHDQMSYNLTPGGFYNSWLNLTKEEYERRLQLNSKLKKEWYKQMTACERAELLQKQQAGRDNRSSDEKLITNKKLSENISLFWSMATDEYKQEQSTKIKKGLDSLSPEKYDEMCKHKSESRKKYMNSLTAAERKELAHKTTRQMIGRVYVSNDLLQICKRVKPEDVEEYLANGFVRGNHTKRWNKMRLQQ